MAIPNSNTLSSEAESSNMTTAQEAPQSSVRQHQTRLNSAEKAALVAAVAGGMSQSEAAQQFNVHRNTVSRLCNEVRAVDHPANPLANNWKKALVHKAASALERALDDRRDTYRAADIGVKVLTGLGEFVSGTQTKVDAVANIVVQWGRADEPEAQVIDVTPTT